MASISSPAAFLAAAVHIPPRSRHGRIRAGAPAVSAAETPSGAETLYGVLGLRLGASRQEVKTAYRSRARACHPDSTAGSADAGEFMRLHTAYSTLSDPAKRADYDRRLFLSAAAASFPRSAWRRTWETDQCW